MLSVEIIPDHGHILVECDPQLCMHHLVRLLKGWSSRVVRQEFPVLKSQLLTRCTPNDFVSTIWGAPRAAIEPYIEKQKQVSFENLSISPVFDQETAREWTLAQSCELYNAALQEWREMDTYTGTGTTYTTQALQLPAIKEIREEYKKIHAQVLQDVWRRVDNAFQAFFRRVKKGETPGYPRFQTRQCYESFPCPQAGFSIGKGRLALAKIEHVEITLHRPVQGTIKTCTIKRKGSCWPVCFSCEVESLPRTPYTDEAISMDGGVSKRATLLSSDVIEHPRHSRKAEKRLAKAQQFLARQKRGSHQRKKAIERWLACTERDAISAMTSCISGPAVS